jgi:hypothetical protein
MKSNLYAFSERAMIPPSRISKYFDRFDAMAVGEHGQFDAAERNAVSIAVTRFKQRTGKRLVVRRINDKQFSVWRAKRKPK